jgi:putative SOS response-associated peptidase YedK
LGEGRYDDARHRRYKRWQDQRFTSPSWSSYIGAGSYGMCNDYRLLVDLDTIAQDFPGLKIRISYPEGIPNTAPREDIRMTEVAPVIRAARDPDEVELVMRRWSWPGPSGKPVFNFKSEGRSFHDGRCLIPTDGFYEFTDQVPKAKVKHKWLFTMKEHAVFMIAGITRTVPAVGECFTMLTTAPGPDIAPYHDRQVVVLGREDWPRWLNHRIPAEDLLRPAAAGSLKVLQVR